MIARSKFSVRLGDLSQNVRLRSGEVVMVPDNSNEKAYVFGGASGSNPNGGAVSFVNGEAADFQLAPGDVIYVPPTWVTSWNEVLSQLLPTLQTISGVLAPFVQIKYLSQ